AFRPARRADFAMPRPGSLPYRGRPFASPLRGPLIFSAIPALAPIFGPPAAARLPAAADSELPDPPDRQGRTPGASSFRNPAAPRRAAVSFAPARSSADSLPACVLRPASPELHAVARPRGAPPLRFAVFPGF